MTYPLPEAAQHPDEAVASAIITDEGECLISTASKELSLSGRTGTVPEINIVTQCRRLHRERWCVTITITITITARILTVLFRVIHCSVQARPRPGLSRIQRLPRPSVQSGRPLVLDMIQVQ